MLKVMRWDDEDTIILDPLCVCDDLLSFMMLLTLMKVISIDVHLFECNNLRMTGQIFMKFGMQIMPLKPSSNS
jgi:hypothetical protein